MKTSEYDTISAYILGCELTRQFGRSFIHSVGKRPDQHTLEEVRPRFYLILLLQIYKV